MKNLTQIILPFALLFMNGVKSQFSCTGAVAITDGYTSSVISTPGNGGTQDWVSSATATCGTASNSAFSSSDVYLFKYTTGPTAGESFYFTIEHDYVVDDEHAIGVWTDCSGTTLSSCVTSTYQFDNVVGVCAQNLLANTTYYIGIGKQWGTKYLKFKVIDFTVETSATIPANTCNLASSINISEPYSGSTRCNYTAWAGSPSACGMSIENDSWMQFTAASSTVIIDYEVSDCTNNYGVQLSVFRGTCSALTLLSGSCVNYASNNSTGTWTFTGLTVGSTYYIRTDGYAGDLCSYSFSPVSGVVILPITLSDFRAEALSSGYNRLNWTTASEINSSYFAVEKSTDGKNFQEMLQVKAAGSSSGILNYHALDKSDQGSYTYYRIKSVDRNGSFFYSEIKSVTNETTSEVLLYPNPVTDGKLDLNINSFQNYDELLVSDLQGRIILSQAIVQEKHLSLDLSQLPSGVYQLRLNGETNSVTKRFVIDN